MVVVIDYGMGNVWSVVSAVRYLGSECVLSGSPEYVENADRLILPGVGSFRKAMAALKSKGLDTAIKSAVQKGGKILGICLGMQLLGSKGTEDGETAGLGLIPNRIDLFGSDELKGNKLPHVGFNEVSISSREGLFDGLNNGAHFYFNHSYRMIQESLIGNIAMCDYGSKFVAAFQVGNICGTQFHPEKSQTNGLIVLRNFLQ
jgi:glutamine amidotransferase